jgi:hypothetical protein
MHAAAHGLAVMPCLRLAGVIVCVLQVVQRMALSYLEATSACLEWRPCSCLGTFGYLTDQLLLSPCWPTSQLPTLCCPASVLAYVDDSQTTYFVLLCCFSGLASRPSDPSCRAAVRLLIAYAVLCFLSRVQPLQEVRNRRQQQQQQQQRTRRSAWRLT